MLPVYYVLILLLLSFANGNPDLLPSRLYTTNISDVIQNSCPPFESIANAKVEVKSYIHGYTDSIVAVITCNENYSLIGRSMVYCDDGAWSMGYDETPAQCVKRCPPPPYLEHGELKLEKLLEDVYIPTGSYLKGTVAKYSCSEGYILKPSASSKRICQNGQWTGVDAFCKPNMETTCPSPPIIENGYMQPSFPTDYSLVVVGQEVLYQCNTDYKLVGSDKLRCTDEGIWIPEPPSCHKETGNPFADFSSTAPPPTAPVANGMPDFFASQPPANNPPSNTQTMWGNSGVPQQNAFQAPPVQQPQQQPAQQPFGDFFNTNEPSVFDPQAPILQQTQPQQSMPPQRPPQPSKILTGDLESSLNSLVDNLTMDSGSGKWNSPKNQPKTSSASVGWKPQVMAATTAPSYRPMMGAQQPQMMGQQPMMGAPMQYPIGGMQQPQMMMGSPKMGAVAPQAPPQQPPAFDPFGAL